MKQFYRAIFVLCSVLLILLALIDIAIPSDVYFAHSLSKHPDKWELKFTDPASTVFHVDSEKGKSELLSFIDKNQISYTVEGIRLTIGLAVATLFCLIGWMREKRIEKIVPSKTSSNQLET